jgi:hypothetical protein
MNRLAVVLFSLGALLVGGAAARGRAAEDKPSADDLLKDPEVRRTLDLINDARKKAGLEEVRLSAELSLGCKNHARYLLLNRGDPRAEGLKAHEEDDSLKGATKEGARAAKASVVHFGKPAQAAADWMASFYHRVPLLLPTLREVGIGYDGDDKVAVSLVDCISGNSGKRTKDIVYYPEDGQTDVPRTMGREMPSPLPRGHRGPAGFPITASFFADQKVKKVEIALTGPDDKPVAAYVSTPDEPASDWLQWNTVCIIPKEELAAGTMYKVALTCELSGKPFTRTWSFTTAKKK